MRGDWGMIVTMMMVPAPRGLSNLSTDQTIKIVPIVSECNFRANKQKHASSLHKAPR